MVKNILKSFLSNKLFISIWSVITFLSVKIWYLSEKDLPTWIVSRMTILSLIQIVLVLLLVSIGLATSLFILHQKHKGKINLQEFTFVNPPGYFTHPKYPYPICQYCRVKSELISPVSQIDKDTWYCNICENRFPGGKGEAFNIDDF